MPVQQPQLPVPDEIALAHSQQLTDVIRAEMTRQGGQLTFRDFMQLALYAPALGYYVAGSRKLGADGDFVTAPEIAPLFSQCLAEAIIPALQGLPEANILEVGAGRGVMAAEILAHLSRRDQLPAHYYILELSGELRARQASTIEQCHPDFLSRVVWLDTLPNDFSAVVLGN